MLCRNGRQSGDESITSARDGFYEARTLRVVLENGPDIADGALQHRVAHEAVTPDFVEQDVLSKQCVGVTGESAQQTERRGRQCDRTPGAKQECIRFVEFELTEAHT